MSEFFLGQQNFGRKLFWVKKNLSQQNLGKKKCVKKNFWVKKNLGQHFWLLHESSSWVKIGLHAENQLPG